MQAALKDRARDDRDVDRPVRLIRRANPQMERACRNVRGKDQRGRVVGVVEVDRRRELDRPVGRVRQPIERAIGDGIWVQRVFVELDNNLIPVLQQHQTVVGVPRDRLGITAVILGPNSSSNCRL